MTILKRILMEAQLDGTWNVSRERALDGESASGMKTLTEAIGYVLQHEDQIERWEILDTLMKREIKAFRQETEGKETI